MPRLRGGRRGATLLEYLIALGAIALLCFAAVKLFGGTVSRKVYGIAQCVADFTSCGQSDAGPLQKPTSDTGEVTLTRTTPVTPVEVEDAPTEEDEVIEVDPSSAIEEESEVLRKAIQDHPTEVDRFVRQQSSTVPDQLWESFRYFRRMRGEKTDQAPTVREYREFRQLLGDYRQTFPNAANTPVTPAEAEEFFSTWTPGSQPKPVTKNGAQRPTNSASQPISTKAPSKQRQPQTQRPEEKQPPGERMPSVVVDRINWGGGNEGNEAFTEAAVDLGYSRTAAGMVIQEVGSVPLLHYNTDPSKTNKEWFVNTPVDRDSLYAKLRKKDDSVKVVGGKLVARYTMEKEYRALLDEARRAEAAGCKTLQECRDKAKQTKDEGGTLMSLLATAKSCVVGAVGGDLAGDQGASGLTCQVLIGAVPVVGQIADGRDVVYSLVKVWNGEEGAWVDLIVTGVAIIPVAGDALKVVFKVVRKGVDTAQSGLKNAVKRVITKTDSSADQIAKTTKKVDDTPTIKNKQNGPVKQAETSFTRQKLEALKAKVKSLVEKPPTAPVNLAENGKRFLVRQPGFPYDLRFAERTEEAVQAVVSKIKNGDHKSLREVMDDLAARRGEIAKEMRDPQAFQFGVNRTVTIRTPLQDKYKYAAERASGTPDGSGYRQITANINGEEIDLTTVVFGQWIHTDPKNIGKVMAYAETLYKRALDPTLSTEDTIRTVGELHYYLAHAAPYVRGSAAITDMTTKAIFDVRGITTPIWKPGIVPDIEALVTSNADDFVKSYANLFETVPTRKP